MQNSPGYTGSVNHVLDEALNSENITKSEYDEMNPDNKVAGRFYCNFKVHKNHKEMEAPPVRPIISGSGSITENISLFIEHHIKDISTKHMSYLQDFV